MINEKLKTCRFDFLSLSFLVHKTFGHSLFLSRNDAKHLGLVIADLLPVFTFNSLLLWWLEIKDLRPLTLRAFSWDRFPCAKIIPPLSITTMSSQSGKYWVEWVTKSRVLFFKRPFFPRTWSKIARPTWASTALWSRVVRCGQIFDHPKLEQSKFYTLETKRIVENVNISFSIDCSSDSNSLFLPSG